MLPTRILRIARPQILRLRYPPPTIFSLSRPRLPSTVRHSSSDVPSGSAPPTVTSDSQTARSGANEPRLSLTFTCTAANCDTRSSHQFTKRSYEKGIVLIECPGCKKRYVPQSSVASTSYAHAAPLTIRRHLIADNLGWFKDSTEDGKLRNVEDLLRARGESIRRGRLNSDGSIEVNE
ncbi:hypothetical protein EDB83DRAFT_2361961 [Lactarius deliciosus]|nr:hypothetical protein EDB83DRAFT_2361961 [Lactarius deliciosus]